MRRHMNAHQIMDPVGEIAGAFETTIERFNASSPLVKLQRGEFGIHHYKSILREVFHYTREDPQMQSLVTVYFRGEDRDTVKLFLKHATSEIGHEYLALKDLESLGQALAIDKVSGKYVTTIGINGGPSFGAEGSVHAAISPAYIPGIADPLNNTWRLW